MVSECLLGQKSDVEEEEEWKVEKVLQMNFESFLDNHP